MKTVCSVHTSPRRKISVVKCPFKILQKHSHSESMSRRSCWPVAGWPFRAKTGHDGLAGGLKGPSLCRSGRDSQTKHSGRQSAHIPITQTFDCSRCLPASFPQNSCGLTGTGRYHTLHLPSKTGQAVKKKAKRWGLIGERVQKSKDLVKETSQPVLSVCCVSLFSTHYLEPRAISKFLGRTCLSLLCLIEFSLCKLS